MQPIDIFYLYSVGKQMQPLGEFRQGAPLSDLLLPLVLAEGSLNGLLNLSVFGLRTSKPDGDIILQAIRTTKERALRETTTDPNVPLPTLEWHEHYSITSGLTRFENVLAAEMRMSGIFMVTPKKGLDTGQMISDGSVAFPSTMAAKVPAAVPDTQQAMRCIVFELPTAAGFHLHRANESVLRCYWDAITSGKPRPKDRNMGTYLNEMDKLQVGDKVVKSALRDLKDQHRNPLIHPEHSLESVDEAYALYCGVFNAMEGMLKAIATPAPLPPPPPPPLPQP